MITLILFFDSHCHCATTPIFRRHYFADIDISLSRRRLRQITVFAAFDYFAYQRHIIVFSVASFSFLVALPPPGSPRVQRQPPAMPSPFSSAPPADTIFTSSMPLILSMLIIVTGFLCEFIVS
jgi:hypothetical protein